MKKTPSRLGYILANIIILVAGIILIIGHNRANFLDTIVFITGIVLIFPGIFNIFQLVKEREDNREEGKPHHSGFSIFTNWIASAAAIILGILMCIYPEHFKPLYTIVFGGGLALAGLFGVYMLGFGVKNAKFPRWTFILPLLTIVAGVVILVANIGEQAVVLVTGIGLIIFALTRFVEMIGRRVVGDVVAGAESAETRADHTLPSDKS